MLCVDGMVSSVAYNSGSTRSVEVIACILEELPVKTRSTNSKDTLSFMSDMNILTIDKTLWLGTSIGIQLLRIEDLL